MNTVKFDKIVVNHTLGSENLKITLRQRIVTEAEIEIDGVSLPVIGQAVLNPDDDNNAAVGARIALNRAFQKIEAIDILAAQYGAEIFPAFSPIKEAGKVHYEAGREYSNQTRQAAQNELDQRFLEGITNLIIRGNSHHRADNVVDYLQSLEGIL